MYCPACSAEAKPEQKFCRSCGFNLQPIIPLVGEHQQKPQLSENIRRVLQKIEWLGLGIGGLGVLTGFGAIIFKLLVNIFYGSGSALWFGDIWKRVFGIGLLLLLKGAFLFVIPWLMKEFFPFKSTQKTHLDSTKTKELLPEPTMDVMGSVTEHTTRNLEPILQARQDRTMN